MNSSVSQSSQSEGNGEQLALSYVDFGNNIFCESAAKAAREAGFFAERLNSSTGRLQPNRVTASKYWIELAKRRAERRYGTQQS
jgi:hypothetical protein